MVNDKPLLLGSAPKAAMQALQAPKHAQKSLTREAREKKRSWSIVGRLCAATQEPWRSRTLDLTGKTYYLLPSRQCFDIFEETNTFGAFSI
jgi:hypothetical protein